MTYTHIFVWSATIVFVYVLFANRLLAYGAKYRLRVLELGDKLLRDDRVPIEIKKRIEAALLYVPLSRTAWGFAIMVLPVVITIFVRRAKVLASLPPRDAPYIETLREFTDAYFSSSLCNSPLAAVLFIVQMAMASFLVSSTNIVELLMRRITNRHDGGWLHGAA